MGQLNSLRNISDNEIIEKMWKSDRSIGGVKVLYNPHVKRQNELPKDLSPHFHIWNEGKPSDDGFPLTQEMKTLLYKVRSFKK